MSQQPLDVLIIGAGVSGIAMGCALERQAPGLRYRIVDRRARPGGTWDLFRYPGVRSDSDMLSYAFRFRPWRARKVLADGGQIQQYLADTAREAGLEPSLQQGVQVRAAHWSSAEQLWTVHAEAGNQPQTIKARFVVWGTGYYDHDHGHSPAWPNLAAFQGTVVHPQHWPEALQTRGKRIVVIGSGATAVSLAPALADRSAEVTLLQRSPSYLLTMPSRDLLTPALRWLLPARTADAVARWLNVAVPGLLYRACRRWPEAMRRLLLSQVSAQLPDASKLGDFTPRYAPWDQRLCVVADGDLFQRVRDGSLKVVTDEIERFEPGGLVLASGRRLGADIVVTATGLRLQAMGGIAVQVDGKPWRAGDHMLYRGVLPEGLPNAAWILGYINAAWTLKAELAATYVCRLLEHMARHGQAVATAVDRAHNRTEACVLSGLSSGYVQRAAGELPRQGREGPWRVTHRLADDRRQLLHEPIADDVLRFDPVRGSPAGAGDAPVPLHAPGAALRRTRPPCSELNPQT